MAGRGRVGASAEEGGFGASSALAAALGPPGTAIDHCCDASAEAPQLHSATSQAAPAAPGPHLELVHQDVAVARVEGMRDVCMPLKQRHRQAQQVVEVDRVLRAEGRRC
jgi:hypothetical protein